MKTKNIINILRKLDLDEFDIKTATASFSKAEKDVKGSLKIKLLGRLWYAKEISKKLKWQDNRLLYVDPSLKKYDVEPMLNITANGDNSDWVETSEGGRPIEDVMLDQDPDSQEYKDAVKSCYWAKGLHPRSQKARLKWYRRNAGAYHVYEMGEAINPMYAVRKFEYEDSKLKATFLCSGTVWQTIIEKKLFWKLWIKTRQGYEIDNVIAEDGVQLWYPIEGHILKAPVTKSSIPFWKKG